MDPVTNNNESSSQKKTGERGFWRRWNLPVPGFWFMAAMVLLSLIFHLVTAVPISYFGEKRWQQLKSAQEKKPIKIKIVEKKKQKDEPFTKPPQKILETPQKPTEKPEDAEFLGATDHKTDKQTKVADNVPRAKASDPGQQAGPKAPAKQATTTKPPEKIAVQTKPRLPEPVKPQTPSPKLSMGSLTFDSVKPTPRNTYENLLPMGVNDLPGAISAGYQDYVDDDLEIGDKIDINTTQYRYIGYFTNMRKSIELVWTYPVQATRQGLQGEVGLEFAIEKDGNTSKIRVVKSSGYQVLDDAIVEAIRLASPFSPLPDGFQKERLVVTGNFRYILTSFGGH